MLFKSPNNQFNQSDPDFDLMVLKLDLDMVKMYHHTKNEVSMSRHSKVLAQTDKHRTGRQTGRQTDSPRVRAVINFANAVTIFYNLPSLF